MLYNEVSDRLQKLINKTPTQGDFIKILGLKQSTVSERARRNSKFLPEEILKLNEHFGVNLYTNTTNNNQIEVYEEKPKVKAEYYPDVLGSCGGGAFELSQEHYTVELPVDCFFKQISKVKKYSVINAYGDSMLNTIKDGDKLIIEHTESEPIQDNKIYVFCYDNQIYVKRLINNIDELVVVSDNPDKTIYKTKYISKADRDNLYLIGQVVGLARNLR